MISFAGSKGSLKLFVDDEKAVVIDSSVNLVLGSGDANVLLSSHSWDSPDGSVDSATWELASSTITTLDINVITASARMYTIPDGAKAEAKKALEWRKEEKRGGTPVGLNTARTLAKGGQIGIEKIRHIAKYFPRHEVDKKGKGWKPGDDQFPSNGRIAWALWGGDAAWRWARAIVERENKKSVTAGGYALPGYHDSVDTYKTSGGYDASVDAFKDAYEMDENYGPEFMARVCMDGSGVDRLYKIDLDGKVCVWDDGRWDDLGHVDGDVWLYDNALDDPYDHVEKDHFLIDPESAVYISAMLQANPLGKVRIEDMDPDEARLVANGLMDEDLQMLDYALVAAGDSMSGGKAKGAVKAGDGQYTEAERSSIASSAPRDATGKFAKAGGRAVIGNDASKGAGTIVGRSSIAGNIKFKLDSGKTIDIPAKYSTPEEKFVAPKAPSVDYGKPLDTEGILGEPRTPQDMPNAQLPGTLPPMTPGDLKNVLNDWDGYVAEQRASFDPFSDKQVRQYAKDTNQKVREVGSEKRTPLPGQKKGSSGSVTTVKDGKLTTQSGPAPKSSGGSGSTKKAPTAPAPAATPVAQAQGVGKAKAFQPPGVSKTDGGDTPVKPVSTDPKDRGIAPGQPAPKPFLPKPLPTGVPKSLQKPAGPATPRQADGPAKRTTSDPKDKGMAPGKPTADSRNAPGSNKPSAGDSRNAPGSNASPKPTPKADPRNAPGSNAPSAGDSRNAPGSNASPKPAGPATPRQADGPDGGGKPAAPSKPSAGGTFTKEGQYVIQKGDNLWALAEKYKPKGETTASYWNKVMKANPKGNFKSKNPSLIYSGEKVNLPGVTGPAAPTKPKFGDDNRDSLKPKTGKPSSDERRDSLKPKPKAPAKPSSDERRDSLKPKTGKPSSDERRDSLKPKPDSRNAPGSNKPSSGDSRNAPGSNASPKGKSTDPKDRGIAPGKPTPDSRNAPGSNKSKPPVKSTDPKDKGIAPGKPKPDSRNAPGSNAPGKGDSRNAPGSNKSPAKPGAKSTDPKDRGIANKPSAKPGPFNPVKPGTPKSLQKPKGPATPRQADGPAKRTTSDPKDKGMAPGKPSPKLFPSKPVESKIPDVLKKPVPNKQPGGSRVLPNKPSIPDSIIKKRGSAGSRKRRLPEG